VSVVDAVRVANNALRLIGIGQKISSLDDENHRAEACKDAYHEARDLILSSFKWPFTTRRVALGLVEADPNDDWRFSYRYPINCVVVRRIADSAGLPDYVPTPFTLGQDDTGRLIYTDVENAAAEYSATADDPGEWPNCFADAVSGELAERIAPIFKVGNDKLQMAQQFKAQALMRAQGITQQEQMNAKNIPAAIRARGAGWPDAWGNYGPRRV
jgi:hypothetical protein